jgi:hypothetical protein
MKLRHGINHLFNMNKNNAAHSLFASKLASASSVAVEKALIQPAASGQENKLEMLSHESQASELSHQPVCFPGEIATSNGDITMFGTNINSVRIARRILKCRRILWARHNGLDL